MAGCTGLPMGPSRARRGAATDADAVASVRLDRSIVLAALEDAAALERAEFDGDKTAFVDLFAGLTVFTTAALIEP